MKTEKKSLATLFMMSLASLFIFHAQGQILPNQDFEKWATTSNYEEPINWSSTNGPLSNIPGNAEYTLVKTTDAYSGTYAALLQTRYYSFIGTVVPGVLTNGKFSLDDQMNPRFSGGTVINIRPARLQLWYKYAPADGDSFGIHAFFTKTNQSTGKKDTVGIASLRSGKPVNAYSLLEVPVQYFSQVAPDSVLIIAVTSDKADAIGSKLYIDDIAFSGVAGMGRVEKSTGFEVSPNPAGDCVQLKGVHETSKIILTDIHGRTFHPAITRTGGNQIRITLEKFTPGVYFISIIENEHIVTRTLYIM
jgi:hypothetical protein